MEINRQTRDYINFLISEIDVDAIDIFCCDKTSGRGEMFDVYAHGMEQELKLGYRQSRIFEVDPFTDPMVREGASSVDDAFELGNDPKITVVGQRAEKYWRFMAQKDVEIVGAATRRFLPGFYLVVGVSRSERGKPRRTVAAEQLDHHLLRIKDMVSANILSLLIRGGDGYAQLRNTIAGDTGRGFGAMPELSPRESEIARLICLGRQNKEIAYVTGLSEHTIENHLKRIYRKLEIHNRAALVARMNGRTH